MHVSLLLGSKSKLQHSLAEIYGKHFFFSFSQICDLSWSQRVELVSVPRGGSWLAGSVVGGCHRKWDSLMPGDGHLGAQLRCWQAPALYLSVWLPGFPKAWWLGPKVIMPPALGRSCITFGYRGVGDTATSQTHTDSGERAGTLPIRGGSAPRQGKAVLSTGIQWRYIDAPPLPLLLLSSCASCLSMLLTDAAEAETKQNRTRPPLEKGMF